MRKKYIIDKEDLPKLIKGESMTLANGGAFSIEINGTLTNGDVIKAMFPSAKIFIDESGDYHYVYVNDPNMGAAWKIREYWWNSPYKECEDGQGDEEAAG